MYPQMNSPTILSPVNSPRYIYQSGNSNQLNWAFSRKNFFCLELILIPAKIPATKEQLVNRFAISDMV